MPSQEDIAHQQNLLKINRARLKVLIEQQTTMGTFTPPYIRLEIDSARSQIREIKQVLKGWNVAFNDLPGDDEAPAEPNLPATATTSTTIPIAPKPKNQRRRKATGSPDVYISYHETDQVWVS